MKNHLFILTISWLLVGCSVNVNEQEFAGTYTYETIVEVDMRSSSSHFATIKGTIIYRPDGTFSEKGTRSFSASSEIDVTDQMTLTDGFTYEGTWQISNGNHLFEQRSDRNSTLYSIDNDDCDLDRYFLMTQSLLDWRTAIYQAFDEDITYTIDSFGDQVILERTGGKSGRLIYYRQ